MVDLKKKYVKKTRRRRIFGRLVGSLVPNAYNCLLGKSTRYGGEEGRDVVGVHSKPSIVSMHADKEIAKCSQLSEASVSVSSCL